eukprot:COSAG01_NODE_3711_length_5769_cov_10.210545_9_plen_155_part_00
MIYETKVKNGEFERCKCRAVAQGFGFKKTDFDSCFAAAPSLQSNRLISALCAVLGWTRVTFDINQAYLLGRAPPDAQFPMRYPSLTAHRSNKHQFHDSQSSSHHTKQTLQCVHGAAAVCGPAAAWPLAGRHRVSAYESLLLPSQRSAQAPKLYC